jgi:vitamin B12 transporter
MSMKKLTYLLTVILLSKIAQAQNDSTVIRQMDVVILTATKSKLKQSQTGKIVTVIDQQMIRNSAGRSLAELLNTQAGFFINGANNNSGTNLDVYFRGASAGNMLIVIDGFPVYDPSHSDNSFDLNSIPLEQIEKIEILKGGQSTLWGSDAVAGVIQIFLKKEAQRKLAPDVSFSYGSYNTIHVAGGVSGRINRFGYSIQYNYIKSRGMSSAFDSTGKNNFDKDGFEQHNLKTALTYKLTNQLLLKTFANLDLYKNSLDETAFTDDKDYTAKNKNNIAGASLQYSKKGVEWNFQASYQVANRIYTDDSSFVSSPYSKYSKGKFNGKNVSVESYINVALARHINLTGGLQYIHQNTEQSYLSINNVPPPYGPFDIYSTALGRDSAKIDQVSGYASLLINSNTGFNMELGGRINNHSIYGTNATYTFNPSYNIDANTKIALNISSAYKIPSLYQLYSEYGNKELKPESSTTYELGLQAQSDDQKLSFRFAAFKRNIKNLIIFYTDPVSYASQYINRDKQNDHGFELESNIRLSGFGNWNNNFSFIDGHGTQDHIKVDNLYRRPKFIFNSILTLIPVKALTVIPSFRYTGARLKDPYDAGPPEQPSYYTVDLFAGYDLNKNARLFADLHNITDQKYFDVVGYNSKGFNMQAGINLKF